MSTRRSARLQALESQEPTSAQRDTPTKEPTKTAKRKETAGDSYDKPVTVRDTKVRTERDDGKPTVKRPKSETQGKKIDKMSAKPTMDRGDIISSNYQSIKPITGAATDLLWACPREILNLILKNIDDTRTLGRLSITNKNYYTIVTPQLWKRLSISVSYHAHIAKLIRKFEPLLSINQRKQLKKEGQYRGQQDSFSNKLDHKKMPVVADYVRQAIFAIGDPGKNHRYIVERYVEEAMKNMNNIEIVETSLVTESIAKSIAGQKNLRALNLGSAYFPESECKPLSKIKDLKHLAIHVNGFGGPSFKKDNIPLSLIFNSRSTLRSLSLETGSFFSAFLDDWPKSKRLTSLKSFHLTGASIDEGLKGALTTAIDFTALEDLKFGYLSQDLTVFFGYLSDTFSKAHNDENTEIKLRSLALDMGKETFFAGPEEQEANVDARIDFISSFDTLTSLELHDYGQYPQEIPVNPDLKSTLVSGILKHENLTRLKISYRGVTSNYKMTCLEPITVANLVDNLPKLKEFEFIPEPTKLVETGKLVCRGRNLTSVTLITGGSWSSLAENQERGIEFLHCIFHTVLNRDADSDEGVFKWEDHSDITRVAVDWMIWEIGSKLGKSKKGMKKVQKMTVVVGKQKREVQYREITDFVRIPLIHGGGAGSKWVDKVEQDLR
ncbi:hypothetical protein FBEOM_5577 [Fusarium beomiforme]|uniref:F-box domain-containing protein n=1 Tax=Fusarium beomiforme TaxID=44412 RepID=A0A9P5AL23_9HYPO|nr:hypothetical protein FBEOM_5577 [Fusarium beomiforme]